MSKRRVLQEQKKLAKGPTSAAERLQTQINTLVEQKKYRQALEKFKQIQQTHPEISISPSEAEIWMLQGQQEFANNSYRQAEASFRQALACGAVGEAHYWQAKTQLAQGQTDAALGLMQTAFEAKVLPKDYAGCYLKLLFMQGQSQTVAKLIEKQSKRFFMPQVHWARGMLALDAQRHKEALAHFQKMGRPATPNDLPTVWIVYAHQCIGDWQKAESDLGFQQFSPFRMSLGTYLPRHLAMQRLAIAQAAHTSRSLSGIVDLDRKDLPKRETALILALLGFIEKKQFHDAAHTLHDLNKLNPTRLTQLEALRDPILRMGGEQARQSDESECTEAFWSEVLTHSPFDPQLAYKLQIVCDENESYRDREHWLRRIIDWMKQEAKDQPQNWPEAYLAKTLAALYCDLADSNIANGQRQKALKYLQEAEQLYPESPEAKGRRGLLTYMDGKTSQAVSMLTQAIEEGCTSGEAYAILLECLKEQGNTVAINDIRQRFGQKFGDVGMEMRAQFPEWVEVLATQNYEAFEELVLSKQSKEPALGACRIFVNAAKNDLDPKGRVTLNQAQATKKWERLLQPLTAERQVPVLQAIFLALHLFAKPAQGIAQLLDDYLQRLAALSSTSPNATEAHLVLLVVNGWTLDRLETPLRQYLKTVNHSGTALAQIQLQARRFAQTATLQPAIEEALRHEPQHPQLLLAKATTFPLDSNDYETLKTQGFELARRLQDAPALQAFREEESFQAGLAAGSLFPDLINGDIDPRELARKMARQLFGSKLSPEELENILPELEQMLLNGISSEDEDFDEDNEDEDDKDPFGFNFGFKRPSSRSKPSEFKGKFPFF